MIAVQCQSCGRVMGAKRALGFGTYFMVVITLGLWLLAIPFCPLRCVVCGEYHGRPGLRTFAMALASILAVGAIGAAIRDAVVNGKEPVTIINAYEERETANSSKQRRHLPRMTLNYPNRTVTYSENDSVTVTPAQLIANGEGHLNHKIILNDAKLTDKLGKRGPCDAILLFGNGTIAACIPEQSETTDALHVGESTDMACVVNNLETSDPRVVLRDCVLIRQREQHCTGGCQHSRAGGQTLSSSPPRHSRRTPAARNTPRPPRSQSQVRRSTFEQGVAKIFPRGTTPQIV